MLGPDEDVNEPEMRAVFICARAAGCVAFLDGPADLVSFVGCMRPSTWMSWTWVELVCHQSSLFYYPSSSCLPSMSWKVHEQNEFNEVPVPDEDQWVVNVVVLFCIVDHQWAVQHHRRWWWTSSSSSRSFAGRFDLRPGSPVDRQDLQWASVVGWDQFQSQMSNEPEPFYEQHERCLHVLLSATAGGPRSSMSKDWDHQSVIDEIVNQCRSVIVL